MRSSTKAATLAVVLLIGALVPILSTTAAGAAEGDSYRGLTPARLMDSRPGKSTVDGVSAGVGATLGTTTVKVTARGGVPATGVAAVAVNVTVVDPVGEGFTTVFPTGQPRPTASTVNFTRGQTIANMTLTAVGTGGTISIHHSTRAHTIVDVVGWLPVGGDFVGVGPARIGDTRANGTTIDSQAARTGSYRGDRRLQVTGRGGVPSTGVGAVAVNITFVGRSTGSYASVFPTGQPRPNASAVNAVARRPVANMVIAQVGAGGGITIHHSDVADVIVDVVGWFPIGGDYTGLTPARINDTRPNGTTVDGLARRGGAHVGPRSIQVTGRGGVPASGVGAVALNITSTGSSTVGHATLYPTGQPRPNASTLNFTAGATIANMVIAQVGTGGTVTIDNSSRAHVVIDVVGWFPGSPLPAAPKATAIAVGSTHSCALTPVGGVKCWGDNFSGQLGNNTRSQSATPVDVVGLTSGVVDISAGTNYTCAVTNTGAVKCWGSNIGSVLGNGSTAMDSPVPVQVSGLASGVRSVSTGTGVCVAMTNGSAKCWGNNFFGQIGDGTKTDRPTPTTVTNLSNVAQVAAGGVHNCAVTTAGAVRCWGSGTSGQLGNGGTTSSSVPVAVTGLGSGVARVSAGDASCAVLTNGTVRCWGANLVGTVGAGETTGYVTVPTDVVGLAQGSWVSTRFSTSCGVSGAGAGLCWGSNSFGQLGDGTTTPFRKTATAVSGLGSGVARIESGGDAACALTTAGNVTCWGARRGPLVGLYFEDTRVPRPVPGLS